MDVLKEYMQPGSVLFVYADTDSFLLGQTELELIDCVKPALREKWQNEILPKWFANETLESQKEPGLLKVEAEITRGWYLGLSPKCYMMASIEPSELERRILADPAKCFETLENARVEPPAKIHKRSAKGCKQTIPLR